MVLLYSKTAYFGSLSESLTFKRRFFTVPIGFSIIPFDLGCFGDNVTRRMSYDLRKNKHTLLLNCRPSSEQIFRRILWKRNISFSAFISAADIF